MPSPLAAHLPQDRLRTLALSADLPTVCHGAARLVVAVGDNAGGRGELAWLQWMPGQGLVLERGQRTDEPINPDTLAVSASTVAIGAAAGRRKLRGRLFWFGHAEGGGTLEIEAPATSARFSPSCQRLEVLMAEIVAGVQRFVPEVSARTGVKPQTPVCRMYGELLPLTMLKP